MRIWELTFPGLVEEVGPARRWVRDALSDSPHAEDAALIVSELGTNALLHSASGNGAGTWHVHLARSARIIALSVTDAGGKTTAPHLQHPDGEHIHGRGLLLVQALADHVHIRGDEAHGWTVTAELRLGHGEAGTTRAHPGFGAPAW